MIARIFPLEGTHVEIELEQKAVKVGDFIMIRRRQAFLGVVIGTVIAVHESENVVDIEVLDTKVINEV